MLSGSHSSGFWFVPPRARPANFREASPEECPLIVRGEEPLQAWLCLEIRTEQSWLDHNNHVNFRKYLGMVGLATDYLCESILTPQAESGAEADALPTFFTLEADTRYIKELLVDQDVRVYVTPIERTEKTIRALVQIYRVEGEPELSAESVWTGAFIDPDSRKVTPIPETAREIFDEKLARVGTPYQPPSYPRGYDLPEPPPEKLVTSVGGVVRASDTDRMGHVGVERYTQLFLMGNIGFLTAIGLRERVFAKPEFGKFLLASHIRYLEELREGDEYKILSRMLWVRRKTAAYHHRMYRVRDGEEVLAGTCTNTFGIADLRVRKIIPLPDFLLEVLSEIHGVELKREMLS